MNMYADGADEIKKDSWEWIVGEIRKIREIRVIRTPTYKATNG
jgi:hypothetical protein